MFQEGDGQLLQLAKELKVLFNCAKCQKELEPPISHCISGHEICSQCKGSSCPFCSAGYAVSSKLMEQVFKVLPKPCKYLDRGCSHVSVSGRHEPFCEFRTIKCRVGKDNECTWSGTVKDWKEHVQSEHKYDHRVFCDRIDSEIREGKINVNFFKVLNWNNNCIYLKCDNKTFLFYLVVNCGEVHYAVRYVPVKSVKDKYILKVTFLYGRSTVLYKNAVEINVLKESELLEDISNYCGKILVDELQIKNTTPISIEFTLIRRKAD